MAAARPEPINLARGCRAVLIPSGREVVLNEGDRVVVIQTLGGTFTVQTETGYLARIAGEDGDALGLEVVEETQGRAGPTSNGVFDLDAVTDALRAVFDPEIPVNVVDLGLIYECEARPVEGGQRVEIKMSMTAPGCGMGDVLRQDAQTMVLAVPGVREVEVELVWDPPWNLDRMSDAAKLQLGMF